MKQSALLAFILTSAHVLGGRARASVAPLRSLTEDVYVCPYVSVKVSAHIHICMHVRTDTGGRARASDEPLRSLHGKVAPRLIVQRQT